MIILNGEIQLSDGENNSIYDKLNVPQYDIALAKAKADASAGYILGMGDSVIQGAVSTGVNSWFRQFRQGVGEYLNATTYTSLYIKAVTDLLTGTGIISFAGTWSAVSSEYAIPDTDTTARYAKTSTNDDYIAFPTYANSVVEVVFPLADITAGSVKIYHDYEVIETIDLSAEVGDYYTYTLKDTSVEVVSCQAVLTAGQELAILSVDLYNADLGAKPINISTSGTTAEDWVSNMNLIDYIKPKCTMIELGGNDIIAEVPTATYKTRMQTMITNLLIYGDVILVSFLDWNTVDATILAAIEEYRAVQYELASENDIPIIDFAKVMISGAWAESQGLLADTIHPNDYGHQYMYRFVRSLMGL